MLQLRAVLVHGGNIRGFQGPSCWDATPAQWAVIVCSRWGSETACAPSPTPCPNPRNPRLCSHSCDYVMFYGRADLKTGTFDQWAPSNHTNLQIEEEGSRGMGSTRWATESLKMEGSTQEGMRAAFRSWGSSLRLTTSKELNELGSRFFPRPPIKECCPADAGFQPCEILSREASQLGQTHKLPNCELRNGCLSYAKLGVICYTAIENEYIFQG